MRFFSGVELVLEAVPDSQVIAIDMDPTLLVLAQSRLERFGSRATIVNGDLRCDGWTRRLGCKIDAAVSSTALH